MAELIALIMRVLALLKALERWATPLIARYWPQGPIDPGSVGFNAGDGHAGVDGGG